MDKIDLLLEAWGEKSSPSRAVAKDYMLMDPDARFLALNHKPHAHAIKGLVKGGALGAGAGVGLNQLLHNPKFFPEEDFDMPDKTALTLGAALLGSGLGTAVKYNAAKQLEKVSKLSPKELKKLASEYDQQVSKKLDPNRKKEHMIIKKEFADKLYDPIMRYSF